MCLEVTEKACLENKKEVCEETTEEIIVNIGPPGKKLYQGVLHIYKTTKWLKVSFFNCI